MLKRALKAIAPETEVVLMTAYGTVENAVEAMKLGAYDFVEQAAQAGARSWRSSGERREATSLVVENRTLRRAQAAQATREIVGQIGLSLQWRRMLEVATQAAPSSATVLILGESGTGKELLARSIHEKSAAR